jgi:hypothetical protein
MNTIGGQLTMNFDELSDLIFTEIVPKLENIREYPFS